MPRVASRIYPIMLSVAEVAAAIGVERVTVYEWIANGLPLYRIGVKRKILVADLVEYLRAHLKKE